MAVGLIYVLNTVNRIMVLILLPKFIDIASEKESHIFQTSAMKLGLAELCM